MLVTCTSTGTRIVVTKICAVGVGPGVGVLPAVGLGLAVWVGVGELGPADGVSVGPALELADGLAVALVSGVSVTFLSESAARTGPSKAAPSTQTNTPDAINNIVL